MQRVLPGVFLCLGLVFSTAFGQDCLNYEGFPTQLGYDVVAPGPIDDMTYSGTALFATYGSELAVYDLSDVEHPSRILTLDLGGDASNPCASGDLLAVAVDGVGVRLFDI